jgi:hypothetical protein
LGKLTAAKIQTQSKQLSITVLKTVLGAGQEECVSSLNSQQERSSKKEEGERKTKRRKMISCNLKYQNRRKPQKRMNTRNKKL